MRPIFQLGYFPVGRKRERVTTRRERTCSGDEKAIRNTRQSAASGKSRVDMTRPHKSLSLFIAHQPTGIRDRSNPESLCSAQMEEFRPDVEIVLHDDSTIGSTAEWGERTRHERTSGNENQTRPATEIKYHARRSPLCGAVLRDHFREHLIRCQASSQMCRQSCAGASGRIFLRRDPGFTSWGPQFHLMGSSVSLKRTPVSSQTFTHTICGWTHKMKMGTTRNQGLRLRWTA